MKKNKKMRKKLLKIRQVMLNHKKVPSMKRKKNRWRQIKRQPKRELRRRLKRKKNQLELRQGRISQKTIY